MTPTILPVEGWVERCASYAMSIVRAVVMQVRDDGPLDGVRVRAIIKRAGIGADVPKASPTFDTDDGAERILNFLVTDIDEVERVGDLYRIAPDVRSVRSKAYGFTVQMPPADEAAIAAEVSYRTTHLRSWAASRPFENVWRNGLVEHSEEEVIALADWISAVGYLGDLIVRDQNGVIITGHLRHAALSKLGINPADFTQEVVFTSEFHRLAFVLAAHRPWSPAIREAVRKVVNKGTARTGVKLNWPDDVPIICAHGQTVVTAPAPVETPAPNVPHQPRPRLRRPVSAVTQEYVDPRHIIHRLASWIRDNPGHTQREITDAVMGVGKPISGTLNTWIGRGLLQESGGGRYGKRLVLTTEGQALLDAPLPPPLRPAFRKGGGFISGGPGSLVKAGTRPRSPIVQRLIMASERGEWTTRADLDGGVKFSHVLRKWMWFEHEVDGNTYLFIPDSYRDRPLWKKAQVRRMTGAEVDLLNGLLRNKDDEGLYEAWELLVSVEHERLFG